MYINLWSGEKMCEELEWEKNWRNGTHKQQDGTEKWFVKWEKEIDTERKMLPTEGGVER